MDRPGRTNAMRGLGLKPVGAGRFEHLKRLLDELELSAEQRARVEGHFRESQDRLKKLLKPLQPEASRELRELRLRLAIELNPEQRLQFERLLSERLDRGRSRP